MHRFSLQEWRDVLCSQSDTCLILLHVASLSQGTHIIVAELLHVLNGTQKACSTILCTDV